MLDEIRNPLPLAARGLPESDLIPDRDAARAVRKRLERSRRFELGPIGVLAWTPLLIVLGFVFLVIVDQIAQRVAPPMPFLIDLLVTSLLPIAIVIAVGTWIQRHVAGLAVREILLERGIPVCLGCGYDLSATPGGETRCPECGRVRTDPAFKGERENDRRAQSSDSSESQTV